MEQHEVRPRLTLMGKRTKLEEELDRPSIACMVWCSMGINLLDDSFTLPKTWPKDVAMVVCMKYGAELAAKKLKEAGAPLVIWFSLDVLEDDPIAFLRYPGGRRNVGHPQLHVHHERLWSKWRRR